MLSRRGHMLASGYNEVSDLEGGSAVSSGTIFKDKLHVALHEPPASLTEESGPSHGKIKHLARRYGCVPSILMDHCCDLFIAITGDNYDSDPYH
jgi:hypothetical protein